MEEIVFQWLEPLMASPWIYLLLGGVTLGDAIVPVIPGELPMNLAGAYSGIFGFPHLILIMICCAAGAIIGDNICFVLGRSLTSAMGYLRKRSRLQKAITWVNDNLYRRDASVIVIARFIPGARWVVTVMLGSGHYSHARFAFFDAIGVIIWSVQGTLFGYLGGWVFREQPLIGLVSGMVLGVVSGLVVERLSHRFARHLPEHTTAAAAQAASCEK
ncbi:MULTISPECIES: DedA family protein [unclassified Corynebacterium]|uniref:DedA family protein n=1 Tax=unclassified Corynebacterium TaxID=2624378 RepID=UPI001C4416A5|nr:DedA family protein [Corynebacterium sp. TAE3-ERU30]MBV7302195.1 DedA family protein [Corynebacterium sp. TAE3-ERU2]